MSDLGIINCNWHIHITVLCHYKLHRQQLELYSDVLLLVPLGVFFPGWRAALF